MIIYKKLKWGNAFSYGDNNEINFTEAPLVQLLGLNGHGKSSIALILEECLFNKNSKGIKKADILNRNIDSNKYWIEFEFSINLDNYVVKTTRGSTQTVKLTKNGSDISSHTSTSTYKAIEELIGYDHKMFSQIVYLSDAKSLEFLTATDTNRKKFLIELLNLTKYSEACEQFKSLSKAVSDQVNSLQSKINTINTWIDKHSKFDSTPMSILFVPGSPKDLVENVAVTKEKIKNIDSENRKIIQNNKYKELRDSITPIVPDFDLVATSKKLQVCLPDLQKQRIELNKDKSDAESFIRKMNSLGNTCVTCLQPIDKDKVSELLQDKQETVENALKQITQIDAEISSLESQQKQVQKIQTTNKSYEDYSGLYNPDIQSTILDKVELEASIQSTEKLIRQIEAQIQEANENNARAATHNAKIVLIQEQLVEMSNELAVVKKDFDIVNSRLSRLQVLVKTFSPTGLVAYKIECLVKDLEDVTNEYLTDMSGGRFQLGFKIAASDKLNVVITDNGKDIDILALSGGERARVNTAALLGIRKLMQSLSNTRTNLLILDETISSLDIDGKEKLVEILLKEPYLNTIVVAHDFSHPLLDKIQVIKENNISRLER